MNVQFKVEYKKVPGKNFGLHVQCGSRALRDKLVRFVVSNNQWLDAPFHRQCKRAGPFIQSDSYGDAECFRDPVAAAADDELSYLFIEFWSSPSAHAEFLNEMLRECEIELTPPEPVLENAELAL